MISQLQQQLAERNVAVTQLQTLLSSCEANDNQEESRRVGELVGALTSEIQRGQPRNGPTGMFTNGEANPKPIKCRKRTAERINEDLQNKPSVQC